MLECLQFAAIILMYFLALRFLGGLEPITRKVLSRQRARQKQVQAREDNQFSFSVANFLHKVIVLQTQEERREPSRALFLSSHNRSM